MSPGVTEVDIYVCLLVVTEVDIYVSWEYIG